MQRVRRQRLKSTSHDKILVKTVGGNAFTKTQALLQPLSLQQVLNETLQWRESMKFQDHLIKTIYDKSSSFT